MLRTYGRPALIGGSTSGVYASNLLGRSEQSNFLWGCRQDAAQASRGGSDHRSRVRQRQVAPQARPLPPSQYSPQGLSRPSKRRRPGRIGDLAQVGAVRSLRATAPASQYECWPPMVGVAPAMLETLGIKCVSKFAQPQSRRAQRSARGG